MPASCLNRIALALLLCTLFFAAGRAQSPNPVENPLGLKPHHITAAVADIDRAVAWYQDMLGFKVTDRGSRPGGVRSAELAIPDFGIGLVQNATSGVPGASVAVGAPAAGPRWIHIVFSVSDPARTYTLLKARGGDVRTRGNGAGPITTFTIRDSEGNEIEFVSASPISR